MTTWTKVTKASGTAWTKVTEPQVSQSLVGQPIGLLLALTYAEGNIPGGTQWTKVTTPSGTTWTKVPKAT